MSQKCSHDVDQDNQINYKDDNQRKAVLSLIQLGEDKLEFEEKIINHQILQNIRQSKSNLLNENYSINLSEWHTYNQIQNDDQPLQGNKQNSNQHQSSHRVIVRNQSKLQNNSISALQSTVSNLLGDGNEEQIACKEYNLQFFPLDKPRILSNQKQDIANFYRNNSTTNNFNLGNFKISSPNIPNTEEPVLFNNTNYNFINKDEISHIHNNSIADILLKQQSYQNIFSQAQQQAQSIACIISNNNNPVEKNADYQFFDKKFSQKHVTIPANHASSIQTSNVIQTVSSINGNLALNKNINNTTINCFQINNNNYNSNNNNNNNLCNAVLSEQSETSSIHTRYNNFPSKGQNPNINQNTNNSNKDKDQINRPSEYDKQNLNGPGCIQISVGQKRYDSVKREEQKDIRSYIVNNSCKKLRENRLLIQENQFKFSSDQPELEIIQFKSAFNIEQPQVDSASNYLSNKLENNEKSSSLPQILQKNHPHHRSSPTQLVKYRVQSQQSEGKRNDQKEIDFKFINLLDGKRGKNQNRNENKGQSLENKYKKELNNKQSQNNIESEQSNFLSENSNILCANTSQMRFGQTKSNFDRDQSPNTSFFERNSSINQGNKSTSRRQLSSNFMKQLNSKSPHKIQQLITLINDNQIKGNQHSFMNLEEIENKQVTILPFPMNVSDEKKFLLLRNNKQLQVSETRKETGDSVLQFDDTHMQKLKSEFNFK